MTKPVRAADDATAQAQGLPAPGPDASPREAAQERGSQRSVFILVGLFLLAFLFALAVQGDARRRELEADALRAQTHAAALLAARVNGDILQAWGGLAGAAEMARLAPGGQVNAQAVLSAASRARVVRGAVLLDGRGRTLSATEPQLAPLAAAAQTAAAGAPAWAGVVVAPGAPPTLALTRRSGEVTLVALLDGQRLLPDDGAGAMRALAAQNGAILAAAPPVAATADIGQLLGVEAGGEVRSGGALGRFADGRRAAVGRGTTETGAVSVYVAAPAPGFPAALWGALLQIGLLALAPLGAVGALLLLLRQNAARAVAAEAEAERVEIQYKITADGAQAGLFEWRPDADQVQLSEQLVRMLRAPRDTLPLRGFLQLIAPEDMAVVQEDFAHAAVTGALDTRFRVPTAGTGAGPLVWIEARGLAVGTGAPGEPVRLFATAIDVTGRRDAELRASALEKRLREAIDSFSGPFALWDSRRRLALCNRTYARLFRLPSELTRHGATFDAVSLAAAAHIRRERIDPEDGNRREVELVSGEWLQLVERRTADGGLLTIGVDISALKRQEEDLTRNTRDLRETVEKLERSEGRNKVLARQAEEERRKAEDASRAKSVFLANMSHELRTPLNAIIGFSDLMSKQLFGPIGNEQYASYVTDIHESGKLLLELINDVLDMAKIEAGKYQLAPRPLDPSDAIDQAVRISRPQAEEKGLRLVIDAEDLPEIEADHRAVKQVLINLLSNAIKFTETGAVMVHARPNEAGLVMRIIDTGRGIPKEHLPRLTRAFEQVESELSRNTSGTGLGLALSKSLVEMHGGSLTIESEVGRGTVVTVTFPREFAKRAELHVDPA